MKGENNAGFGGERRGLNPNYFLPKPVKVGDVVEVTIEGTASRGDGLAKVNGFVVFVKGTKPGDKLQVKIVEVRTKFAIGEPVSAAASAASA
ncbi:MAG: TRAM domain-containing protein [Candidatus Micrarchaeia archaeon]|jgi:predicted RNA-binding protein with TRAM domain